MAHFWSKSDFCQVYTQFWRQILISEKQILFKNVARTSVINLLYKLWYMEYNFINKTYFKMTFKFKF